MELIIVIFLSMTLITRLIMPICMQVCMVVDRIKFAIAFRNPHGIRQAIAT